MPSKQGSLLPVYRSNSLLAERIASGPLEVPVPEDTVFSNGTGNIWNLAFILFLSFSESSEFKKTLFLLIIFSLYL